MQTSVVQRRQTSALAVAFGSVCASWVIAAGLSTLAWWNGPEGVPYSLLIAFACAATVLVSWGALRRRDGGSTVRAAAWPLLGWCPYLFGGAAVAIGEPIVVAHWRCGTGDMGLLMLALLSVPVVFALAIVSMLAIELAWERSRGSGPGRLWERRSSSMSLALLAHRRPLPTSTWHPCRRWPRSAAATRASRVPGSP